RLEEVVQGHLHLHLHLQEEKEAIEEIEMTEGEEVIVETAEIVEVAVEKVEIEEREEIVQKEKEEDRKTNKII
ncbi:MAG: hypothetical protein PHY55_08110, partial [Bacteroidales bacterium]|nr:hypothetical protein [Bacteroidales bacterium]